MGLFDNLVKTIKDSGIGEELSKVGKDIEKSVNGLGDEIKQNTTVKTPKTIPSDYSHFPAFEGTIRDINTKNIDKYHRCTIDYEESTIEKINEYRNKVIENGYQKMTDVRYEKGNEYIIIDPDNTYMHLVFHVKH